MKFVSQMSNADLITLNELKNNGPKHILRERAHVLLLSHKGFSIPTLTKIFDHHRDSISHLIDRWEKIGLVGLYTKPGQGRPKIIKEEKEPEVLLKIHENPRSLKKIIAEISSDIGLKMSLATLKRFAKSLGLSWKRVRKSLKSKRSEDLFEKARFEIDDLIFRAKNNEIDLVYFDESSFSLTPYLPYAWQPKGQHIEINCQRSNNINVLGFMSYDGSHLDSFVFDESINSSVVIACFDKYVQHLKKETVIIIDNAPTHTSGIFQRKILEWKEKGLFLKFLPPYSPELNRIEIVWKFMKYHWIELWSYSSYEMLRNNIFDILKSFGTKYQINFA